MRYVNLSTVLVYRLVSQKGMDRFPDYESLVIAKLMLPQEVERLEKIDLKTPHESTWTPILWATKLITRALKGSFCQKELMHAYEPNYFTELEILNFGDF